MADYSMMPNIEPIKIMLNTNIPGKESLQFTSSMIYHPSVKEMPKLSELPFIVIDRPYSRGVSSYLNLLTFDKKVKFFFNKDSHLKGLSTVGLYTPNKVKKNIKPNKEEDENKKNEKTREKEVNAEIEDLIRQINERKLTELKKMDAEHKKKIKELEKELEKEKEKDRRENTKSSNIKKDIDTEIGDEKIKYEKKIKLLKLRFKYQIKYVKAKYIQLDTKKYVLKKPDGLNTKDDTAQIDSEHSDAGITEDEIAKDTYEPLYTKDNGEPKYPNLSQELANIKTNEEKNKAESSKVAAPIGAYEYANENIMILLQTLFPNSFPILNNITESFKMMVLNAPLPFTFKNAIPEFLRVNSYKSQFYSYLKIDGKIYTSTRLIWLNDIYNHPTYSALVLKYKIFNGAKKTQKTKLEGELKKKRDKFKQDFQDKGAFAIDQKLVKFFQKQKKPEPETPVYGDNSIRELNQTIDTIIENIEELISYLDFDPPKYKLILDVTNSIRQLYKKIEDKIVKTKEIDTKLTRLIKSISSINIFEVIFSKYLDSDEVVLDYETEEEGVKTELKAKYQFYVTFVDSLKEFIRPTKESSNSALQDVLEDFSSGALESQGKFDILMDPTKLLESSDKKAADTGVSILPMTGKDPRLEIHVQIDFIEGEVNDENKSKINCIYKGAFLGNMLDELLYPQKTKWELDKKRLFFNINDKEAVLPKPPTEENKGKKDEPTPPPQTQTQKQGGGKTKKYRLLPIYKLRSNRRTRRR
jgi:hypothetical protein